MAGSETQARLTLDSTNFDANMKKSAEVATATGRAAAKAAKESAAAQAVAAKFAGEAITEQTVKILAAQKAQSAASRELREVQSLVNRGALEGAAAANTEAAALQRVIAARLAAAAATEVHAHAEVSQRMAASAAVRGLENGNVGIRSVENFLTTIPGVGAALQAVFPLLGAGALVGMLVKMGSELVEVGKKASNAGRDISRAFEDQHEKAQVANDDLAIQNDKLGDEIAKLSGHPGNGLETALDKSRKMADQLLESLQADRKELDALLKEHDVSYLGNMLSGVATTGQQAAEMVKDQQGLTDKVRAARDAFDDETTGVKDPAKVKAATDKRNAVIKAVYQSQIDTYKTESKRLRDEQAQSQRDSIVAAQGEGGVGVSATDNSAKIANINGRARQLADALRREGLTESIGEREATVGRLKGAKEGADADKKANELRFKAMEAHLAEWKTLAPVSQKAIYDYWEIQKSTFATASEQYNRIVEKQATLAEEGARRTHEALAKFQAESKRSAEEAAKLDLKDPMAGWNKDNRKATAERIDASNELNAQQARNTARMAELQIQEATGKTMTKLDAATQLAAVHTAQYGAELDRLLAKQKAIRDDADLTEAQREKELAGVGKDINQQKAGRALQVQQDAYNVALPDSSLLVGGKEALQDFVREMSDAAKAAKTFTESALNRTNQSIVKAITERHGGHTDFGQAGSDIFKSGAGTLLNAAEGKALSGITESGWFKNLGLGSKTAPKGTSSDPLFVKMAGSDSTGAMSSVSKMFTGSGSGDSSGGGGGFASFISAALPFIAGFADGGEPQQNSMAWVGERGPELVHFGNTRANVIPNHKLADMGGGGGDTHHWNIDARGASDPAQVRAQIMQAAPHIIAAANSKASDDKRRSISK